MPPLPEQVFFESDLRFAFPATWIVRKFDETVAYRSLSGHGLKGVDFICLDDRGRCWLIEVKNYRVRTSAGKDYRAVRRRPEELARRVAKKFADSRRLIRIIHQYVERSWWRRVYRSVLQLFPSRRSTYAFWDRARSRVREGGVVYVLWMETPEVNTDYDEAVRAALLPELPPEAVLHVAESSRPNSLPFRTLAAN